jgi:23S rRNA (guanosine2251-2'-O)-methyltransferase
MAKGFCPLDEVIAKTADSPFPLVLALDQVQDPGNLGTLCRTLFALGGGGIIVPKNRSAFPGPAASRASAGALEKIPMAQVTNLSRALETCAQAGMPIYGAGLGPRAANLFATRLFLPAVLVLGNEEKGIRPGVLKRCDHILTIPMAGTFDSLNVAQAGAMIMGQFLRTRHAPKE